MDFSNKTSLFDLVSMIIPGYTLIFSITGIFGKLEDLQINSMVYLVPILAASYIVGMFIHHLSKLLFDPIFKENIGQIKRAHEEVYGGIDKNADDYLERKSDEKVKETYYERYYISIDRYKKSNIHILEAQFSFIRSMIVVIPFLAYLLNEGSYNFEKTSITNYCIALPCIIFCFIKAHKTKLFNLFSSKCFFWTLWIFCILIILGVVFYLLNLSTFMLCIIGIETATSTIKEDSCWNRHIYPLALTLSISIMPLLNFNCNKITTEPIDIITYPYTFFFVILLSIVWILPAINKQICKSVWEDEYYTRDLDN